VHQLAHRAVALAEQVKDSPPSGLGDDVECDQHAGMIAVWLYNGQGMLVGPRHCSAWVP